MKRVVVNGTFDIVHVGHLRMLQLARSLGDYVLVCIDTDRRVKQLKGSERPINNQHERSELLMNLKTVDQVRLFDSEQELEQILEEYAADYMVKGSDHANGRGTALKYCKEIIYFDRIEQYSTTKKIQDIIGR